MGTCIALNITRSYDYNYFTKYCD